MKIKPLREWFALGPDNENDEEGRKHHWYNKYREYGDNERWLVRVGDIWAESEYETGGVNGAVFTVEIALAQEDTPIFYIPGNEHAKYDVHYIELCFWRWGIHASVRGRVHE